MYIYIYVYVCMICACIRVCVESATRILAAD